MAKTRLLELLLVLFSFFLFSGLGGGDWKRCSRRRRDFRLYSADVIFCMTVNYNICFVGNHSVQVLPMEFKKIFLVS